jgi:hypothetical protein
MVVLKGLIKRTGAITSGETIGVLPLGYRPSEQLLFQTSTNSNVASRIDVTTDGRIVVTLGDPGWLALDGINFIPSSAPYTFTNLTTPTNGWAYYGTPYALPAYTTDTSGRIHLKGLLGGGTSASLPFINLPPAIKPGQDMYLPAESGNAFGDMAISSVNSWIVPPHFSSSWISMQAMYYPASYAGWSNLTLQGGWSFYGGVYTTPQYTKSTDGMIVVKGFIKGGTITAGTVVATLPVGYRPLQTIMISDVAWDYYARWDIQPNGNIVAQYIGNNGWASMNAITFYGEQ